ncbi:MAG: hypothetical protein ACRD36_14430, partial [Candidatus Acidiferrum sp.]
MPNDTDIGGHINGFPATRASLVRAATSEHASARKQAVNDLIVAYWKPVYKYLRLRWQFSNEDAKDFTQAFFAVALEKEFFSRFDPRKARFRTFVRICLDGFVSKENRSANALKRGGSIEFQPFDFAGADGEISLHPRTANVDPEQFFRQEWLRGIFTLAVDDLRQLLHAAGKSGHFAVFERYDLANAESGASVTYAQLAIEYKLPTTQITNYLACARREFRRLVLERIRSSTGSDE